MLGKTIDSFLLRSLAVPSQRIKWAPTAEQVQQ